MTYWWIDLPELTSIQLGRNAFRFKDGDDKCELIIQGEYGDVKWQSDLPKVETFITTNKSQTFHLRKGIVIDSDSITFCFWIDVNAPTFNLPECENWTEFSIENSQRCDPDLFLGTLYSYRCKNKVKSYIYPFWRFLFWCFLLEFSFFSCLLRILATMQ